MRAGVRCVCGKVGRPGKVSKGVEGKYVMIRDVSHRRIKSSILRASQTTLNELAKPRQASSILWHTWITSGSMSMGDLSSGTHGYNVFVSSLPFIVLIVRPRLQTTIKAQRLALSLKPAKMHFNYAKP